VGRTDEEPRLARVDGADALAVGRLGCMWCTGVSQTIWLLRVAACTKHQPTFVALLEGVLDAQLVVALLACGVVDLRRHQANTVGGGSTLAAKHPPRHAHTCRPLSDATTISTVSSSAQRRT